MSQISHFRSNRLSFSQPVLILSLLYLSFIIACTDNKTKKTAPVAIVPKAEKLLTDSLFEYHFNILDSVVKSPPPDTMYHCCYNSIQFMETNTGIIADVDGDYAGPTGFKKQDLENWHKWYDSVKLKATAR